MASLISECLQYGLSGPSCQQVSFICESSGSRIDVGISFISLFSKRIAHLITESQSVPSDVCSIILPAQSCVLKQLFEFMATGVAIFDCADDAFAVGKVAGMLGIDNVNWVVECNLKQESGEMSVEDPLGNVGMNYERKEASLKIFQSYSLKEKGVKKVTSSVETFLCDVCGKSYYSKGSVMAHKLFLHAENSPVVHQECPICKKKIKHVRTASDLGSHINQHLMNRRKYFCDMCSNSFIQRSHLIRHISKRHTAGVQKQRVYTEKQFSCDICGKSYSSRGTLMAHNLFKHTGPTNVICKECPVCKKTVKHVERVTDLGFHIDLHFKKNCDICEKSYAKKRDLLRHMKTKHNM